MPGKKDIARALMLRGTVFVHLDPRSDVVMVPRWLKNQPQLVLQVGLDMPVPIPDLRVDDKGVSGTLSFSRSPFFCSVPWEVVFALVGDEGKGMVWPEDMPPEIAAEVDREARRRQPAAPSAARVEDAPEAEAGPDREPTQRSRPPRRDSAARKREDQAEAEPAEERPQKGGVVEPLSAAKRATSNGGKPPRPRSRRKPPRELPPYLRVVK